MEKLLSLLKDGRSRPVELIASELGTSVEDVRRKIEFLERAGAIRRIDAIRRTNAAGSGCAGRQDKSSRGGICSGCSGCSTGCTGGHNGAPQASACSGCMPEGGFKNMGVMWEVIE